MTECIKECHACENLAKYHSTKGYWHVYKEPTDEPPSMKYKEELERIINDVIAENDEFDEYRIELVKEEDEQMEMNK